MSILIGPPCFFEGKSLDCVYKLISYPQSYCMTSSLLKCNWGCGCKTTSVSTNRWRLVYCYILPLPPSLWASVISLAPTYCIYSISDDAAAANKIWLSILWLCKFLKGAFVCMESLYLSLMCLHSQHMDILCNSWGFICLINTPSLKLCNND